MLPTGLWDAAGGVLQFAPKTPTARLNSTVAKRARRRVFVVYIYFVNAPSDSSSCHRPTIPASPALMLVPLAIPLSADPQSLVPLQSLILDTNLL